MQRDPIFSFLELPAPVVLKIRVRIGQLSTIFKIYREDRIGSGISGSAVQKYKIRRPDWSTESVVSEIF